MQTLEELKEYTEFLTTMFNPDLVIPLADAAPISYIAYKENSKKQTIFKSRMKERRHNLGMSMLNVAKATGISHSTIGRIELDKGVRQEYIEIIDEFYRQKENE